MIALTDHAEGCILPVRAQPGARKTGIVGEQAGAPKVAVSAPPDQGKANKALIEVLSETLGLKKSQVECHQRNGEPVEEVLAARRQGG